MYQIWVVWNREFDWSYYTSKEDREVALTTARSLINSGDGARVKKIKVIDTKTDQIISCIS